MAVNKVSKETKEVIRSNSVLALPDRPTEKGYTAQQLKEYFTNLVLGDSASSLTELDRVVDEINAIIGNIEDKTVQKYVVDTVIGKFTEQAPLISIRFEDNKLKYTKYGNESNEIDITPNNSVFFDNETLKNKNNATIYPKTTLDNIIGEIDDKNTREFLLDLKSKIIDLQTSHDTDIASIEKSLSEIIGGNAPEALNSIKELADALQNDPTLVNGILLDIVALKENKVDKLSGYGLSKNDYTNEDKAYLDELRDKEVALKSDIKTHLSEMGQDSNYRTVTDDEKNTWNSKANAVHKHEISDVNGLQDALDGKSDTGHTHTLESLGAEASGTAEDLISSHNNSLFAHMRIQNSIDNLKKKVDGINNALSFETLSQLQDWINGTYARPDGKKPSDLYVGQHLYIKDQDEQDYWVSETPVTMSNLSVLVTDKIDLNEYTLKSDLKRVAFTGDYGDLSNKPTIPSTLAELGQDDNHKTITQEKLTQIDTNKSNIDKKLNKTFGSSEANKMVVTDNDGNIVTAEAGSMAILVDNLESDSITMAPTANQVRILNNKKLDKQLGTNSAGKYLKVNSNGVVDVSDIQYSEIKNTPTDLATQTFVKEEIAKIPTPDVSGQIEEHNQNEEAHPYILGELNKKVDNSEFETTITGLESDLGEHDKELAKKANQSDLTALSNTVTSLGNTKEDKANLKALAYKDSLSKSDVGLGNVTNTSDADKPVSTATQNALNLKANTADLGSLAYKNSLSASDVGALPVGTKIPSIEGLASETYVGTKIDEFKEFLMGEGAANTLDTIKDIADIATENAGLLETLNTAIGGKVDKVTGKGLSTNDFDNTYKSNVDSNTSARHSHSNKTILDNTTASYTTADKNKLDGLSNYNDSAIKQDITDLENNKVDKVTGKGLSTNDFTGDYVTQVTNNTSARHSHSNKTVLDNTTASYTTEEKTKLSGLSNYDDTKVKNDIASLSNTKADKFTVDNALSTTSTNPIQNQAVTTQVNQLTTKYDNLKDRLDSLGDVITEWSGGYLYNLSQGIYRLKYEYNKTVNVRYNSSEYMTLQDGDYIFIMDADYDQGTTAVQSKTYFIFGGKDTIRYGRADATYGTYNYFYLKADSSLSTTSTNAVQNKVVKAALTTLENKIPSISGLASETFVSNSINTAINNLVNSAPGTLDTLGELATAIQNNESVVATLNSAIGNKADKSSLGTAAAKGVVTSVDTSANLPTSNAVKSFVEGKGYITSSGSITGNAATATTATNANKLGEQNPSFYLDYNNLNNRPSIPSVNNGTLTIQKNGSTLGTFTANQSSNSTINIDVPTPEIPFSGFTTISGTAYMQELEIGSYVCYSETGKTNLYVRNDGNTSGQSNLRNGTIVIVRDLTGGTYTKSVMVIGSSRADVWVINDTTQVWNELMIVNSTTGRSRLLSEDKDVALKEDLTNLATKDEVLGIDKIYPVGSVYLSVSDVSPASFIGGSWTNISGGYALWLVSSGTNSAGGTIAAGLPNITGSFGGNQDQGPSGAFYASATGVKNSGSSKYGNVVQFQASRSSSIYGSSSTVQPPAYTVYAWRRTA